MLSLTEATAIKTVRFKFFLKQPDESKNKVTSKPPYNMYIKQKLSSSWESFSLHKSFKM